MNARPYDRVSEFEAALQMVLDLSSDVGRVGIVMAAARARTAELTTLTSSSKRKPTTVTATMTPKVAASMMRDCARDYRRGPSHIFRRIATLIRTGKLVEARRAVGDLDTLVRDQIPQQVYNWLMRY